MVRLGVHLRLKKEVDVKTKEILAMDVTTDDTYDSEVLPSLIADA